MLTFKYSTNLYQCIVVNHNFLQDWNIPTTCIFSSMDLWRTLRRPLETWKLENLKIRNLKTRKLETWKLKNRNILSRDLPPPSYKSTVVLFVLYIVPFLCVCIVCRKYSSCKYLVTIFLLFIFHIYSPCSLSTQLFSSKVAIYPFTFRVACKSHVRPIGALFYLDILLS